MEELKPRPDLEELAAFIDGRLTGERRVRVLQKIDEDADYYRLYIETVQFLDSEREEEEAAPAFWSGSRKSLYYGLSGLAAAALVYAFFGLDLFKDRVDHPEFWNEYPEISESDPAAVRARNVYASLLRTYDQTPQGEPELLLRETTDYSLALALRNNSLAVTRGALDLSFRTDRTEEGDSRLALLIARELARLDRPGGFRDSAAVKLVSTGLAEGDSIRRLEEIPNGNSRAELAGLRYASMAGYDPIPILDSTTRYFGSWAEHISSESPIEPRRLPQKRLLELALELTAVAEESESFRFGIRLYQLGRLSEARRLLESFRDRFPSREVLNNLGAVHFQLAMNSLARCDGFWTLRFKWPILVDSGTSSDPVRFRGQDPDPGCFQRADFLAKIGAAGRYFEIAQTQGPGYQPAILNQAVTLLASNRIEEAIDRAAQLGQDPRARLVRALAQFALGEKVKNGSMMNRAIAELDRLSAADQDSALYAYNLASMLEMRRLDEPREAWKNFLRLESRGPYANFAREKLGGASVNPTVDRPESPRSPIALGPIDPVTRQRLSRMKRTALTNDPTAGITLYRSANLRVLVAGDTVQIVEDTGAVRSSWTELERSYGPAHRRHETYRGQTVFYSDFGFALEGDRVLMTIYFQKNP